MCDTYMEKNIEKTSADVQLPQREGFCNHQSVQEMK